MPLEQYDDQKFARLTTDRVTGPYGIYIQLDPLIYWHIHHEIYAILFEESLEHRLKQELENRCYP